MEKKLSTPLLNRVREALQEARSPEFYWDYNQQLSAKQINKMMVLPDGLQQVEMEIMDQNWEYADQLANESALAVLGRYRDSIAAEWEVEEGDITDDQLKYMVEEYELYAEIPGVDPNISQLIGNSRPRAVLQLDLHHPLQGWSWLRSVEYDDVRGALKLFNVNPRKMHPKFPNLSYRNGKEFILPRDLKELWDNATYGGRYVMPIDLDLLDYHRNRDHYLTGLVLHKGDEIWMHDYLNGSGSISVPLQKDLTILRRNLAYHITDDNHTAGYGLEEVYGLCRSAWDNTVSPIKTDNPKPYTLPAVEEEFSYLLYGAAYTPYQSSTRIRAFIDTQTYREEKKAEPGELMQWDINHYLWDEFPSAGKKYLRTQADREATHYVFKIKECIAQASFIHCQFIVHDPSRKIVWSTVSDSDRSYEVYHWAEQKIAQALLPPTLPDSEIQ
jgi:hypothetical protein